MRKRFGQFLRIGIAPGGICLLRCSRWGRTPPEVMAEQAWGADDGSFAALALALRELLAKREVSGWPASFVIADDLVRLWQVTPPQLATRLADLEAATALRFHSLFGESPAAWHIAADWDAVQPFFAAAMPRALKAVLEQAAQDRKLAVTGMEPHFIAVWNRWRGALKPGAWFGVAHDKIMTLAAIDGGQLRAVRALPLPAGADHYWLTQMAQREALLFDLASPQLIQLCGSLPPALLKPITKDNHIPTVQLGAGQAGNWSPAAQLASAGGAA
jgi:hypothetical protein